MKFRLRSQPRRRSICFVDATELLQRGVHTLRYLWLDNSNIIRSKAVNLRVADGDLNSAVHVSQAQLAQPAVADEVVLETGLLRTRDLTLHPDWNTLRVLPWSEGSAAVMCEFTEGPDANGPDSDSLDSDSPDSVGPDPDGPDSEAQPRCPRGFLQRVVARSAADGFEVLIGVEVEFALLRSDAQGRLSPIDQAAFAMDSAYDGAGGAVMAQIISALGTQGLPVSQFHPESGHGHWELSLSPLTPLAAADAIVAVRQTVRAVAGQHGMEVSFLPLLSVAAAGCGLHLHVSLDGPGDSDMGTIGPAFIGGVLAHLEPLLAASAPSPLSLLRYRPHFSVGAFRGWGLGNKEAPLRVIAHRSGVWRDVEFKAADATANPYTAVGCLLAAGLDGVRQGLQPPPPLTGDPACLTPSERAQAGIVAMPHDPLNVLAMFTKSEVFAEAMGEHLHRTYAMVRADELHRLHDCSFDEQIAILMAKF